MDSRKGLTEPCTDFECRNTASRLLCSAHIRVAHFRMWGSTGCMQAEHKGFDRIVVGTVVLHRMARLSVMSPLCRIQARCHTAAAVGCTAADRIVAGYIEVSHIAAVCTVVPRIAGFDCTELAHMAFVTLAVRKGSAVVEAALVAADIVAVVVVVVAGLPR